MHEGGAPADGPAAGLWIDREYRFPRGLTGFVSTAAYAASKHGVVGLTKTAAIEYAPKVRVNCVCPGWINTDMTAQIIAQRGPELLARVPFREVGTA